VIDDKRKLMNPLDQNAHKLEAHIHVISGDQNRIKNFETIFQNLGFEKGAIPVFSGVASAFGTLTAEEKENGTLLIDLGGGTAEFMAVRDMGILHSGTVPVGLDHVANDLSVGLDLYIDVCRKIITDKKYLQHKADGKPHMEFTRMTSSVPLKTPIISIDTIIEQRLREIFEIIRRRLEKENVLSALNFGAVITGGGALFPPAVDIMRSVFELPVRIGEPLGVSGAVTNMSTPRHSAVWGLLKFGEEMRRAIELSSGKSMFDRVIDLFDNMSLPVFRNFSSIKNTIKI
jgi:cell division protein FtsA